MIERVYVAVIRLEALVNYGVVSTDIVYGTPAQRKAQLRDVRSQIDALASATRSALEWALEQQRPF